MNYSNIPTNFTHCHSVIRKKVIFLVVLFFSFSNVSFIYHKFSPASSGFPPLLPVFPPIYTPFATWSEANPKYTRRGSRLKSSPPRPPRPPLQSRRRPPPPMAPHRRPTYTRMPSVSTPAATVAAATATATAGVITSRNPSDPPRHDRRTTWSLFSSSL
uniref:Uncharacterized protein n=1 Tax=Cacopsylla melanoneura TaxID=428564 RepID=A0A8D8MDV8_9HEMI